MKDLIVVKYGEISLKGLNRPVFEAQLLRNLRFALRGVSAVVKREHGRILVESAQADLALPCTARTFGVVSASLAKAVPLELSAIMEASRVVLAQAVAANKLSFKVDTHRANKNFFMDTPQLNCEIGAHLLESLPQSHVDVHHPETVVRVEICDGAAYIYTSKMPGPGGLPVGTSSRGLLLLSGGIDSPVAGWMAMRRGIALSAIHFNSPPFTSERARRKVLDLAAILAAYTGPIDVHTVQVTEIQTLLRSTAPPDLQITLLRRMMLRISAQLAHTLHAPALITGESVGQVASQTLESMATINAVTSMPILRPLVTADKSGIMALAKMIGTYDTSIEPYEDCCTLFVPKHPQTKPKLSEVEQIEANLDVAGLVATAVAAAEAETVLPHPAATLYGGGFLPAL